MSPAPDYKTCRTTPHAARSLLRHLGYIAIRVADPAFPIDIIAWKNRSELLFIRARSSRSHIRKERDYTEVTELSRIAGSGTCPGTIQLWVRRASAWDRYHIMPGGYATIKGGVYDL